MGTLTIVCQNNMTKTLLFSWAVVALCLLVSCALASDVIVLSDANFPSAGPSSNDAWIIKFYAPWCGHCRSLAPTWDSLASELKGKVKVAKMDVTADSSLTGKVYSVRGFPTIIRFHQGKYETH